MFVITEFYCQLNLLLIFHRVRRNFKAIQGSTPFPIPHYFLPSTPLHNYLKRSLASFERRYISSII